MSETIEEGCDEKPVVEYIGEAKQMKQRIAELETTVVSMAEDACILTDDKRGLTLCNATLTEALEKYADEDNWDRYTFVYQEFLGEQLAEEVLRAAKEGG